MFSKILNFISHPVILYVIVIASIIRWKYKNSAMLETLYAERLVVAEAIKECERSAAETIKERERSVTEAIKERECLVEEHFDTIENHLGAVEERLVNVEYNIDRKRLTAIDADRVWRQLAIDEVDKANLHLAVLEKQLIHKRKMGINFSTTQEKDNLEKAKAAKKCKEDELMYHIWYVEYNKKIEEVKAEAMKRYEGMI